MWIKCNIVFAEVSDKTNFCRKIFIVMIFNIDDLKWHII